MKSKIILPMFFLVLLGLDQASKFLVKTTMQLYETVNVIPGFFNLTYVLNPGAAFGMFAGSSPMFRQIFFVAITVIVCIIIVFMIKKEYNLKFRSLAYTMVVAGAIGNMVDRLRGGVVVDFIDLYFKDWRWYTFNIADTWITVGVAFLLIDMVIFERRKTKSA
jgi:signal peptidase II